MKLSEWYDKDNTDIVHGKILIAGHTGNGITLFYRLAEQLGGIIGIECRNIADTAFPVVTEKLTTECCDIMSLSDFQRIDDDMCSDVIMFLIEEHTDDLFFEDERFETLEAFREHIRKILTKETAAEIFRICKMVRINRLEESLLHLAGNNCRLKRVYKVIALFEDYLEQHHAYDDVRLLKEAIDYLKKCGGKSPAQIPQYAVLDDHTPTVMEMELLHLLAKGKDIPVIEAYSGKQAAKSFFTAYGMADEIRCIAEDIRNHHIYPGTVSIYYPEPSYRNIIKGVLSSEGLKAAFVDSYAASESESILFFLSVMDWMKNEYRSEYFERLLFNKAIELSSEDGEKLPKQYAMNYLHDKGYLFTRKPYEVILKDNSEAEKRYLNATSDEDTIECHTKTIDALKKFIRKVLQAVNPDNEEKYSLYDFLQRMISLLHEYRIQKGCERKSFPVVDAALEKILSAFSLHQGRYYRFEKTCSILRKALLSVSVSDKEDKDMIVVQCLGQSRVVASRTKNYVVGMSSDLMLRKTNDSPVMYDSEIRECFGGNDTAARLYCGSYKNDRIKDALTYLMASQTDKGTFTFSYPYYDQSNLRMRAVSGIFEELRDNCTMRDYNTLDMNHADFLYKTSAVTSAHEKKDEEVYVDNIIQYITESSSKLLQLWQAEKAKKADERKKRSEIMLSEEDKKIILNKSAWEDNNRQYVLSASSFDTLLQCPRQYVLEKMYHLRSEPCDDSKEMVWLNPLKRGSFFHGTIEKYIKELFTRSKDDIVDLSRFDADAFEKAFNDMVKEYEIVPAALEQRKNIQLHNIRKAACEFLSSVIDTDDGYQYFTIAAELEWDQDIIDNIELGTDMEGEKRYFCANYRKGSIDRLDLYTDADGKKHYRIVDYKTGMIRSFVDNHRYLLIQHYVYHKALRAIHTDISDNDSISFVFVFPTDDTHEQYIYQNGEFERIGTDPTMCSKITIADFTLTPQIKGLLADFLDQSVADKKSFADVGKFLYPDDSEKQFSFRHDNKAYCDFIDICGKCTRKEEKS